jgi:hypothetical protein
MNQLLFIISSWAYALTITWCLYEIFIGRLSLKKLREGKVRTNQGWVKKEEAELEEIKR